MKNARVMLCAALFAAALGSYAFAAAHANDDASVQPSGGPRDFDFEFGQWRVHHHVKRDGQWIDFDGTCVDRGLVDGSANVEEHTFHRPVGISYGIALRTYDPKSSQWAIWWVDGRDPHGALDPPVKGRFVKGTGTFYSDSIVDAKTIRTRFIWSHISATTAHWEQALSDDGGKTWDTNWLMEFTRVRDGSAVQVAGAMPAHLDFIRQTGGLARATRRPQTSDTG